MKTVIQVAVGWLFTIVLSCLVILIAIVTVGRGRSFGRLIVRSWATGMLRLLGIRVRVQGPARRDDATPRIVTFNHASQLDGYVVLSLLSPRSVTVIKREFLRYPVVGLALRFLDFVAIDRRAPARARQALDALAARVRTERLTVLIAPEGTRSRTGALGAFKLGAFRLAMASDAPIVPMVIRGAHALMPRGSLGARPGTIVVEMLAPIAPDLAAGGTGSDDAAAALAERVRVAYEEALQRPSP